jgi:hypothetical protein
LGVSDFPPAACAASFLPSAMQAASAVSTAACHLHPFSAPASAASASWHFLPPQSPELCPSFGLRPLMYRPPAHSTKQVRAGRAACLRSSRTFCTTLPHPQARWDFHCNLRPGPGRFLTDPQSSIHLLAASYMHSAVRTPGHAAALRDADTRRVVSPTQGGNNRRHQKPCQQ